MSEQAGYLELCFHVHNSENIYLRVPTVWDPVTNEWRGFIKTPKTHYLIHAAGQTPEDMERSFLKEISKLFSDDFDDTALAHELFEMFKAKQAAPKAKKRK